MLQLFPKLIKMTLFFKILHKIPYYDDVKKWILYFIQNKKQRNNMNKNSQALA